ncbi:TPA: spondin domain-containing protein [Vibrio parahaemolyticus]
MKYKILLVAASVGVLAGCPNDDDNDVAKSYRYTVNVENLTANQPMSPLAVLTHNSNFQLFEIGQSASVELEHLAEGDSYEMNMNVWDSGTELNDELAATIPGPAGGGEGFNSTRNDMNDAVAFHAGVISHDDGLADSTLSANHRFLNPGAKVTITRVE